MDSPAMDSPGLNGRQLERLRILRPVETLDLAVDILRRMPYSILRRAWIAGLPIACVAWLVPDLAAHRTLGLPAAGLAVVACIGSYLLRVWLLGQVARDIVSILAPWVLSAGPSAPAMPVLRAAMMQLPALSAVLGLSWVAFTGRPLLWTVVVVLAAGRAAVAPTYLARCVCAPGERSGIHASTLAQASYLSAVRDGRRRRGALAAIELLVLSASAVVLVNLGGLILLLSGALGRVPLASSATGLSFPLRMFLDSWEWTYALGPLAFISTEPLRAMISALVFLRRVRMDGGHALAAIDEALERIEHFESKPQTSVV